tara:strand:- start:128199 stop:128504 length:306 start_codon:yes stop_codon:yes gene_type:complete
MRYLCKKKFEKTVWGIAGVVFYKNRWYIQNNDPVVSKNVIYYSITPEPYNGPPCFGFNEIVFTDVGGGDSVAAVKQFGFEFKKYFYSIEEHRELEINNIIK